MRFTNFELCIITVFIVSGTVVTVSLKYFLYFSLLTFIVVVNFYRFIDKQKASYRNDLKYDFNHPFFEVLTNF